MLIFCSLKFTDSLPPGAALADLRAAFTCFIATFFLAEPMSALLLDFKGCSRRLEDERERAEHMDSVEPRRDWLLEPRRD